MQKIRPIITIVAITVTEPAAYNGKIFMKMEIPPGVPLNPSNQSHVAAAEHFIDLQLGPFLYSLALGRDYPSAYKMTVQDYVPLSESDLCNPKGTLGKLQLILPAKNFVIR